MLKSIPITCFDDQSSGLFVITAKETFVFYGGLKSPGHSTFGCVPVLSTRVIIDVFLMTYFQYFFFKFSTLVSVKLWHEFTVIVVVMFGLAFISFSVSFYLINYYYMKAICLGQNVEVLHYRQIIF